MTGGSKGLGKAMARGLAEFGADVVISSRHEDELQAAAREIVAGLEVQVKYVVADLSRRDESPRLAVEALEAMGKVDILINNAGTNKPQAIDQIEDEVWDELVELNLGSCMAPTRALVPGMKERKWGRVIHISSIMGFSSAAGRNAYSATKKRAPGPGPRQRQRPGPVRSHGQLHRPGPVPDRPPRQPALEGAAGRIRQPHGPGPLGPARRADRPGPPPRQRRRQLHHRYLPHRRWWMPLEDLLNRRGPDSGYTTSRANTRTSRSPRTGRFAMSESWPARRSGCR